MSKSIYDPVHGIMVHQPHIEARLSEESAEYSPSSEEGHAFANTPDVDVRLCLRLPALAVFLECISRVAYPQPPFYEGYHEVLLALRGAMGEALIHSLRALPPPQIPTPFYCHDCDRYFKVGKMLIRHVKMEHSK